MKNAIHARGQTLTKAIAAMGMALVLTAAASTSAPANDKGLSDVQKQDVEKLIHQYILDHPEVIVEAMQRMQARQEAAQKAHAEAALKASHGELVNDPDAPIMGNPKGSVTVVEFFDYRCGFCKRVFPSIVQVLKEDTDIRYVFKEFPILGPESVMASKASLAIWRTHKDKYAAFHGALMSASGGIPEAKIMSIAASLGIDEKQLKAAMADPAIDAILERNYRLAQNLNINGTPAFVIGDQLVPGAIDVATMKRMIAESRGS